MKNFAIRALMVVSAILAGSAVVSAAPSELPLQWTQELARDDGTVMPVEELHAFIMYVSAPGTETFELAETVLVDAMDAGDYRWEYTPSVTGVYRFQGLTVDTEGLASELSNIVELTSTESSKPRPFVFTISGTLTITPVGN